ncbi:protein tyrosine phosphatase family protein [Rubrivivax sp. RP6-9]|uniref:protein tyrosine phosphatase family protein n=1 Tax=Rubrivivax sp. RP6-9 TaxID=3415750 RepID=UPI003CC66EFF
MAAPNVVSISPLLVTSGQPSPQALAGLAKDGFHAVIYLAPSTVPNAVKDEPELLAKQGIEFIHIPVPFGSPDESHFLAVSAALTRLQSKKVLVHCEVNMRASSMVFLHRVLHGNEDPAVAYEAVAKVWSPGGVWRRLLLALLSSHKVSFEPY